MKASIGSTSDLFALVEVVDEYSLGQRLLQIGVDVYAGEYATYRDRLRDKVIAYQCATGISGRDRAGKVETFEQAFARVCFEPLVAKQARKAIPRGTSHTQHQTSKATP